mgnify:CR=1 FL=1
MSVVRFVVDGVAHLRQSTTLARVRLATDDREDTRRVVALCVAEFPFEFVYEQAGAQVPAAPLCNRCERELETRKRNFARSRARARTGG